MSVDDGIDVCTACSGYHCSDLICGNCFKDRLDYIIKQIKKHKDCKVYHVINGQKATCLDVVLINIKNKKAEWDRR